MVLRATILHVYFLNQFHTHILSFVKNFFVEFKFSSLNTATIFKKSSLFIFNCSQRPLCTLAKDVINPFYSIFITFLLLFIFPCSLYPQKTIFSYGKMRHIQWIDKKPKMHKFKVHSMYTYT